MKLKGILSLILLFTSLYCGAQNITAHRGEVEDGYNFWLAQPDQDGTKKPVIIFLHGRSLCGTDLNRVKNYGTIDAIEKGRDINAYVIAPQNPGGSWSPKKIDNVLEYVEKKYPDIDKDRVYVIGMSLGGYGTLGYVTAYPEKVAAAIAMCGGNSNKDSSPLNQVPLWIIHGTGDRDVSVSKSDQVVESMKAANPSTPRLIYDRIPGMNHSKPARVFYMEETYDWLLKHNLKDEGRPVAKSFELNEAQWKSAYNNLNFSGGRKKSSAKTSKTASTNKKESSSKKSSASKSSSKKSSSSKKNTKKTSTSKKKTSSKKK